MAETNHPVKPRYVGIDLVKILASFLVVCVHFFLYSNFYNTPLNDQPAFGTAFGLFDFRQVMLLMRWFAYCCVPLFMITTGYLMKNKTISKKYYLGILRVLILYVIITIICYCFDYHHYPNKYDYQFGGYGAWAFLNGLLTFSGAQYGWYVEYYVTIFLLLPFINLGYNGLKTRKQKMIMMLTVVILSIAAQSVYISKFPPAAEGVGFFSRFGDWLTGYDRAQQIKLFPGYFNRWYPVGYYMIGAYIRDFPPKHNWTNKLWFAAIGMFSLFWLIRTTLKHSELNEENSFYMMSWHYNDYGSWPVAVASTMIFLLLFDITSKNRIVSKVLQFVSEATFSCYLISYIFDTIVYKEFCQVKYTAVPDRCRHMFEAVGQIYLLAMGSALILQGCYSQVSSLVLAGIEKHRNAKAAITNTQKASSTEPPAAEE